MVETDVITHLMDVEHNAAEMLLDAGAEADKRITAAKTKVDADYKIKYEKLIKDFEESYTKKLSAIKDKYSGIIDEYQAHLVNIKQDKAAFASLLDKYFFQV